MKYLLCIFFCFLSISPLRAESSVKQNVYSYVVNVPIYYEKNLYQLTSYLVRPYKNDYDKARAIAYYIASHMIYDEYQYNENGRTRLQTMRQQPKDFLKTRVGICTDFATMFDAMCQQAGIRSGILSGFAMPSKKLFNQRNKRDAGHAWNYFVYRNKKIYVDVTFMAQGATGHESFVTEYNRKRAIAKNQRKNKFVSHTYPIDPFYFDFDYAAEKKFRNYRHVEE